YLSFCSNPLNSISFWGIGHTHRLSPGRSLYSCPPSRLFKVVAKSESLFKRLKSSHLIPRIYSSFRRSDRSKANASDRSCAFHATKWLLSYLFFNKLFRSSKAPWTLPNLALHSALISQSSEVVKPVKRMPDDCPE